MNRYNLNEQYIYGNSMIRPYRVDVYNNSTYNKKVKEIIRKQQEEIAEIQRKIREIQDKYNKEIDNIKEDDLPEIEKQVSKIILGKILTGYRTFTPEKDSYPIYNHHDGPFISKAIKVDCYRHHKKMRLYKHGRAEMVNPIIVKITLENGLESDEMYNSGTNLSILDELIRYLKKSLGKEITFVGMKKSKLLKTPEPKLHYNSGYGVSKSQMKLQSNGLYYTFLYQSGNINIILEKVEILSIPKIGDFIVFNDEYLFNYNMDYNIITRKISKQDPLGEEDWSDEDEEYQELIRKMQEKQPDYYDNYYGYDEDDDYDYNHEDENEGDWM